MAGGFGAFSFVVAPESTSTIVVRVPSTTTLAAGVSGRPLWPSDVTGLVLWLPADQIQGIASGTSLSAWTDSSASAAHATQASAASQPTLVTNIQAGLSAVSFGKATSQLLISQTSLIDTAAVCVAVQPSFTSTALQQVVGSGDTTLRLVTGLRWVFASGASLLPPAQQLTTTAWQTFIGFGSGSTATISVSGSITTGAGPGAAGTSSTSAALGAATASTRTFAGFLGEVLVYNRNLFEIERSSIESYLRTKWAV